MSAIAPTAKAGGAVLSFILHNFALQFSREIVDGHRQVFARGSLASCPSAKGVCLVSKRYEFVQANNIVVLQRFLKPESILQKSPNRDRISFITIFCN